MEHGGTASGQAATPVPRCSQKLLEPHALFLAHDREDIPRAERAKIAGYEHVSAGISGPGPKSALDTVADDANTAATDATDQ